jgi:hypothetical protein
VASPLSVMPLNLVFHRRGHRFNLPIVEEFVVNVGKFIGGKLKLIQGVNNLRIKIIKGLWVESLKNDG